MHFYYANSSLKNVRTPYISLSLVSPNKDIM
ncbi:hypothetical protein RO3G_08142 [Rhizopus delemar RA 99-880]|uniref:Uncharacterized protein n=1 Tax=Rhizopus delemar (strain RA 99-880 / ATCC MYA-4621 / FGSC 9543 / NRRL 43880) TaxID=246409 RepID=I1C4Q7_RHIO9|nr:hypothetical protein RO3G_08142 [Rhizopus delemar RA 99-880]|eukprot:EIE83437.1 hypothetical protein RO3G_08142 [Rhizopus delemar RA 99-880]